MTELNVDRKQRYGKALYMYGIIPLLMLLEEYEQKEDYRECMLISEAIQDRVDYVNNMTHIGDDFDLPRHISQVNVMEKEENYRKNLNNYIESIKILVNG